MMPDSMPRDDVNSSPSGGLAQQSAVSQKQAVGPMDRRRNTLRYRARCISAAARGMRVRLLSRLQRSPLLRLSNGRELVLDMAREHEFGRALPLERNFRR